MDFSETVDLTKGFDPSLDWYYGGEISRNCKSLMWTFFHALGICKGAGLSSNKTLTVDLIMKYPEKPWNFKMLTINPVFSEKDLQVIELLYLKNDF